VPRLLRQSDPSSKATPSVEEDQTPTSQSEKSTHLLLQLVKPFADLPLSLLPYLPKPIMLKVLSSFPREAWLEFYTHVKAGA